MWIINPGAINNANDIIDKKLAINATKEFYSSCVIICKQYLMIFYDLLWCVIICCDRLDCVMIWCKMICYVMI